MKAYHEEILSQLFDGEDVEPDALADALAARDAPDLLVDLARLRHETREDDRKPDAQFYAEMKRVLHPRHLGGWWRLRVLPLPAAIALAGCLLLGFLWLRPTFFEHATSSEPPAAERHIPFVPGRDWHPVR